MSLTHKVEIIPFLILKRQINKQNYLLIFLKTYQTVQKF